MTVDAAPVRPRIVLDCDPGLDDAIAILTAAHHGELVGITAVNGNVGIEHTTHNALVTAQIAGLDVPVHRGAARPLIAPTMDAARIHGATGLGDVALPELTRAVASNDAVAYLCDMARAVDDLHLVAVGPLTNVALALRRDPDLRSLLAGLTIMGGGAHAGNVTPVAEFNVWADPEAAAIVFSEAAPITMVGLDVTHKVLLGGDEAARMRSAGTPAADFAAGLLEFAYDRCREFGLEAAPGARRHGRHLRHAPAPVPPVAPSGGGGAARRAHPRHDRHRRAPAGRHRRGASSARPRRGMGRRRHRRDRPNRGGGGQLLEAERLGRSL